MRAPFGIARRPSARAAVIAAAAACLAGPSLAAGYPTVPSAIWTIAGSGDGPAFSGDGGSATRARLNGPAAVVVDADGNVDIADAGNNRIRRVSPDGTIVTIAGTGTAGFAGDNGPAVGAQLSFPAGLAVDAAGDLFVADAANNRIRRLSPDGTIVTIAGTGTAGFAGDSGPAVDAELNFPTGLAVDSAGGLLVADQENNRIRRIDPNGTILTIAGNGDPTQLSEPTDVAVNPQGTIYIADSMNNCIRVASPIGLGTVVGTGVQGFGGDGGRADAALLSRPHSIRFDRAGHLYVADTGNQRIRRIDTLGTITTLAGDGAFGFLGDGGSGTSAELAGPVGLAVDGDGNVLVADQGNDRVRWLTGPLAGPAGRAGNSGGVGAPGPAGASGPKGPDGALVATAFQAIVTPRAVFVRYALTGPAQVTLRVAAGRGPARIVASARGREGVNVIRWNRRLARRVARPGSYRLTIVAAANGTSTATRTTVRLGRS
jgi:sugar lactone lactonase YvrE